MSKQADRKSEVDKAIAAVRGKCNPLLLNIIREILVNPYELWSEKLRAAEILSQLTGPPKLRSVNRWIKGESGRPLKRKEGR